MKSIPPPLSISVLIGLSLQSLFIILTLENFAIYLEEAILTSPLALPFFKSYVFSIVFTILNVLIGIVLNAMDEARAEVRMKNSEVAAINEISHIIDGMSSVGKISRGELAQLKADIERLRRTHPS